jgi:hypothetical protein
VVETFISTTMNGKVHENLHQNLHDWKKFEKFPVNANLPGSRGSHLETRKTAVGRVHHCDHEPLHHLHPRDGLIDVGQVWRTTQVINDADAVRRSAGVALSSSVNGRCGIRLAPEVAGNAGAGVGLYVLTRPMAVH